MNPILQDKINELTNAQKFECWYLVKHNPDFCNLCYMIDALEEYQSFHNAVNVEDAVNQKITQINSSKGLSLSNNYRTLRLAYFFGLLKMGETGSYQDAVLTDVFKEIRIKCNSNYERTDLYQDVINRQIEKLYISSEIDESYNGVRSKFRIFPIMFLYKVLLELGNTTGDYSISYVEYAYLVSTTPKTSDYLQTMIYIKLLRDDPSAESSFTQFDSKFDNRMNKAIELLSFLDCSNHRIKIKDEYIKYVASVVYAFENGKNEFVSFAEYEKFLCSTKSMRDFADDKLEDGEMENSDTIFVDESTRLTGGTNVILYGVPGAGKSWTIEHEYMDNNTKMERLVFHPDYTYSDFVGQILPKKKGDDISYDFIPGPFTKIMRESYRNPNKKFILAIEEINRGNAPAIFGDIFQLLDRDKNGASSYKIMNSDIAREMYGDENHEVSIPSNLTLLCTMNTSDQNVFTLDTAFQRRWNMRLIENSFRKDTQEEKDFAAKTILDTSVKWEAFCVAINNQILEKNQNMTSSEDKRLGTHFVSLDDLTMRDENSIADGKENKLKNRRFPEKVIKYLWDDAFKFYRDEIFKGELNSLEKVISVFTTKTKDDRFDIFKDNIRSAIFDENKKQ